MTRLCRRHDDNSVIVDDGVPCGFAGTCVVAIDTSRDEHRLSLLCPDCGSAADGTPLYGGEEWGGTVPDCAACGREIQGLTEVSPGEWTDPWDE